MFSNKPVVFLLCITFVMVIADISMVSLYAQNPRLYYEVQNVTVKLKNQFHSFSNSPHLQVLFDFLSGFFNNVTSAIMVFSVFAGCTERLLSRIIKFWRQIVEKLSTPMDSVTDTDPECSTSEKHTHSVKKSSSKTKRRKKRANIINKNNQK